MSYGQNLRKIGTHIEGLTPTIVKSRLKFRELPQEEEWRIPILLEILEARRNNVSIDGLRRRDKNEILHYTCTV